MRGVVISVGSGQVVTLLDIDTGDFKMATVDNIYDLDEEAVSLYALCIRCSLEGVCSVLLLGYNCMSCIVKGKACNIHPWLA